MVLLEQQVNSKERALLSQKALAVGLAEHAHLLRVALNEAFQDEGTDGPLHVRWRVLHAPTQPALSFEQSADLYAQVVCYGFFAARSIWPDTTLDRFEVVDRLPLTSPVLTEIFGYIGGDRLDWRVAGALDSLAEWLNGVALTEIESSPTGLVRFYEDFLAVYNPELRQARGVYYTPGPVVSYIVRSVDSLLKREFGLAGGLGDGVQVLDPAVGTGAFLSGVIDHVQAAFQDEQTAWLRYISRDLLPRLSGFEVLLAPCAIAHLTLGLQLAQGGYTFQAGARLNIYPANVLEAGFSSGQGGPLVIVGNPPYSGVSANMAGLGATLVNDYKTVDGQPLHERKHWLQDDYVKFIRFGQQAIERVGSGILAFISNHGYLDNPTFRGMRQSLMQTFDQIYLLDLHGNAKKRERSPDGSPDENVFDIQQGVAIGIFVKRSGTAKIDARVYHSELWGKRMVGGGKYDWLGQHELATTEWQPLAPQSPYYLFVPQNRQHSQEYAQGWRLTDIMPLHTTGVLTARDRFVIDFEDGPLKARIATFLDPQLDDATVQERLALSENYSWRVSAARRQLQAVKNWECGLTDILYRPFDTRRILYHRAVVWRVRDQIMRHMQNENVGLVCARQQSVGGEWALVGAADRIIESAYISNKTAEINYLFPLYLYSDHGRLPNLDERFIAQCSARLGLTFVADGQGDLQTTFGPKDILNYIYAILHKPTYRQRYAEFLKLDFPRLPLPSSLPHFRELGEIGDELLALHLGQRLASPIVSFPVSGTNLVEMVKYEGLANSGRVWINQTQYFEGIRPEVWAFRQGSYQVSYKWLKDRKGRTLTQSDVEQYRRIITALSETIRLVEGMKNAEVRMQNAE